MPAETHQYDLFLSYHWRDRQAVEAVARGLHEAGLKVFLDRWYLVPGQRWQTALEKTLLSCRAVAVFLGPHGMGGWQQREKELALDRQGKEEDFPVIPVLLPGAEPGFAFLSLNTWVDLRDNINDAESLAIIVHAARGEPPGLQLAEKIETIRATLCPFRGLSCFREEDAPFFFGREEFSDRLAAEVGRRPLVAVVGASGCGKSSAVRAGLLPRLRRNLQGVAWEIATVVPGDRPLRALAAVLLSLLEPELDELDRLDKVKKLTDYFSENAGGLRDVVERVLEKQPGTDRLLLVVDQWEELYTLAGVEESNCFVNRLLETLPHVSLHIVLTLRGDFYGHALAQRSLADALQDAVINLGPMNRGELRRAVVMPAELVGLAYEAGLESRILDDVGDEPGNLPLLEFVLKGLWEERRGGMLHHAAYEAMEGVQGAMAKRAEEVCETICGQGAIREEKLRSVFLDLVHTEEGAKDTRRRLEMDKLSDEAKEVVARLIRERLLVSGRDEATGKEILEVAHEALIRRWKRLQAWLDADRDFRTWRHRLAAALEEWQRSGKKDRDTLLRGGPLAEAERWLAEREADLAEDERAFIRISANTVRWRKILQWSAAAAVLLVMTVISIWQYAKLAEDRERRRPIEPDMVVIEPDEFSMGSPETDDEAWGAERPPHPVSIKKPFAIGRYEVTFAEYDKFTYDTDRSPAFDNGWGRGRQPVIYVSWDDAKAYAAWLSERTGKRYRLPTEAEWEYAARAGTITRRFWDDEAAGACEYANVFDRKNEATIKARFGVDWEPHECEDNYAWTAPVGSFKPNGKGLYDMLGNVWEWVEDCWHENYTNPPEDGSAWLEADGGECGLRVVRGGSWSHDPGDVRSAVRTRLSTGTRNLNVGFRLVQDRE